MVSNMIFSKEEIAEFRKEISEQLNEAELELRQLESGGDFKHHFDSLLRLFHNVKGTSALLEVADLQKHMEETLNLFQHTKNLSSLSQESILFFLNATRAATEALAGKKINFDYTLSIANQAEAPLDGSGQKEETLDIPRIMVIDDEPEIVTILEEIVRDAGFIPLPFTDPAEAIRSLKTLKPSTILSDVKMPQISGFDLLKVIGKIDSDLPIIFISGHLSKQEIIEAFSSGVSGVIEKPFETSHVIQVCKNATQKYRLSKLLNSSISFIYYFYSYLEGTLKEKGDESTRQVMHSQFQTLLETRRKLKAFRSL